MKIATVICCIAALAVISITPVSASEEHVIRSISINDPGRDALRMTSSGNSGPRLVPYWDAGLTERTACLSAGDTVTAYIVAENFTAPVERLEYGLFLNSAALISYLDDTIVSGIGTGDMSSGFEIDFATPADASGQLLIQTVTIAVTGGCTSGCGDDFASNGVVIRGHHTSGLDYYNGSAEISGGDTIIVYGHYASMCDDDGMPDLEAVTFTSPDTAMVNEDISSKIDLLVQNKGDDAGSSYDIRVVFTSDTTVTSGITLGNLTYLPGIAAGAQSPITFTDIRVPLSMSVGPWYLCLALDMFHAVVETDESNNIIYHPIMIVQDPDIDTTCVYAEDFQNGPAGWTALDMTAPESHWHQDEYFDGLETWDVLWCGVDDASYATTPGYGNNWSEGVVKQFTLPDEADIMLSYMMQYDSESDFDITSVQISTDGENFITLESYSGSSGGFSQHDIDITAYRNTDVWIMFYFSSDGGWSDEDGDWATVYGAVMLDWVSVSYIGTDDFAEGRDDWDDSIPGAAGGMFRLEYDPPCDIAHPCDLNEGTGEEQVICNAWVAYDEGTGAFPYGADDLYVKICIESPAVPVPQDAIAVLLEYDVYHNLHIDNNVLYEWEVACPPNWVWTNDNFLYYGESGWMTSRRDITEYLLPGATEMKIRFTALEYSVNPKGLVHNHAPYFDNVKVMGVSTSSTGIDLSSFPSGCSAADEDWDGIGDLIDLCPLEDSAPFDRDGDGCIDETVGSRHIEYLSEDTLRFWIHENGAPGIVDGSDITALIDGIEAWNAVSDVDIAVQYLGTTPQADARALDGFNTVTFSDPDFVFPIGVLAVGITTSFVRPDRFLERPVRPGEIVDADIIFNPNMSFGTPSAGTGVDIQSVATHEAGHLFGISHSAVQTSTMFFVLPPGTEASSLELEDHIALRKAYPDPAMLMSASRLRGVVTDGVTGEPVPGAVVYAIDEVSGDSIASEFTMLNGTFDFFGLPDGDYYVSIHPLNGSSRIGYMQPANINQYVRDHVVDIFVPEYYDAAESNLDDETAKTAVSVTASSTTNIAIVTNIDEEGPTVTGTSPAPADTSVRIDASILISFSEPIDIGTLQGNFSLRDTINDQAVGGNAATLDDDSTFAFLPATNFEFETVYELTLDTGLSDKFGNGLETPFTIYFETEVKPDVGITSLAPRKGIEGAVIVISGYGFEDDPAGNLVDFHGTAAAILEASSTRLIIEVPEGATTGVVTVVNLVEGKTSNALSFTMLPGEEVARGYDAGVSPLGSLPRAMAVSPDGAIMFVATEDGYSAVVVDPGSADYLSSRSFSVDGGMDGIDVTPDGKRVYAVSRENGRIYRINGEPGAGGLDDLQILSEIETKAEPLGVIIEPSGRRAYVATSGNTVEAYDVNPMSATFDRQVSTIESIGVSLKGNMAVDPAGEKLLVLSGEGSLAVCDIGGDSLIAAIDVSLDPRDVAVDPVGKRAYVTDDNGMVTVVSLEILEKVIEVTTGGALRGDAVTPAGSFLFGVNRELNFYDVIDLREQSPTYRSVVANIYLPVNPLDVELSPDGTYAYSICEQDMTLNVTAIGVGPVVHTITPVAGPVGTRVVIAGSGFTDDENLSVSFNGVYAVPEVRRDSQVVVSVPAAHVTGPLTVIGSNTSGLDAISNEVYFEVLPATPADGMRLAGSIEITGLSGSVASLSDAGFLSGALTAGDGSDQALYMLDTDPDGETFHQIIGMEVMPAGFEIDDVIVMPAGDLALVLDRGAGAAGETGHIPVYDVNRLSPGFLTAEDSIDVSGLSQGVSGACLDPAGALLVVAEYGDEGGGIDASVHLYRFDSAGDDHFVPEGSVDVAGLSIEQPVFHPSGQTCYLPVADPSSPKICVLDTDPDSPGYLTIIAEMPLPGSPAGPVPRSLSFTPDGGRCLVLTCDEDITWRRDVLMVDTSDPAAPSISYMETLGGTAAGAGHIDISPRGDRAIASVEGEGLFHLAIVTGDDSIGIVDRKAASDPSMPAGDYTADGAGYYCVEPILDIVYMYDFTAAQSLALVSGGGQSGVTGTELPAPLRVKVAASGGQGVEGVPVTFTVTSGSGLFTGNGETSRTVATDRDGGASAWWVLGAETGEQAVSASSPGLTGSPVLFPATGLVDPGTLPLRFVDAVPVDAATGVSATTAARLVFSRPVDPASVDTTRCSIRKDGVSAPVPALLGFSDGNRRISITPRVNLEPLAVYHLEVAGGILDASGGPLENPGSSIFTIADPPPLKLDAISPPSGIRGVQVVLSGQGFDRDIEDNTVYFNDIMAGITEASDGHLDVVIPFEAEGGTAIVKVTVGEHTSNEMMFRVLAPDTNAIDEEVIQKVGTGSSTRSVVVTPDGALMYAVSPMINSVIVIDIMSLQPMAAIPVGENPFSITIDPEGDYAYVTNFLDHTVSVINISPASPSFNDVIETIEVGLNPIDALVTPDGDRLVVSNLGSMDLSIVDADASSETYHMVLSSVGTGKTTRTMTITPDGGLLYIGTNDGYLVVSVVDFGVLRTVGTGSTTRSVTVTPDGALLVLLTSTGEVLLIDIAEGSPTEDQVVGRVGTGSTVRSVTVTPDGGLLYLILEELDVILTVRLDRVTSAGAIAGAGETGRETVYAVVTDTIRAGEDPYEIAFAPGGAEIAVITNAGDNTVSIYNPMGTPIGIALSGLSTRRSGDSALLEWRTHLEKGMTGFHILRSRDLLLGYERITAVPVMTNGIPSTYSYRDETVRPGRTYYYKLEALDEFGRIEEFGPVEFICEARFMLRQNVPNPFNPVTEISFTIPESGHVRLRVYNVAGQLVRTLVDGRLTADRYDVKWDGTNNGGRKVASGVYFYRIEAGKYNRTRKMVLLR